MPKSVNKIILIGNIGKEPEVKYTPSGTPCAKFSLATNERYKDKTGEWADKTEWHNIIAWSKLAEIVGEYCDKGSKVYVEGKLQTTSWDDRSSGQKRYKTEVVAAVIILLNGKGDSQGNYSHAEHVSDEQVAAGVGSKADKSHYNNPEIDDDSIPF